MTDHQADANQQVVTKDLTEESNAPSLPANQEWQMQDDTTDDGISNRRAMMAGVYPETERTAAFYEAMEQAGHPIPRSETLPEPEDEARTELDQSVAQFILDGSLRNVMEQLTPLTSKLYFGTLPHPDYLEPDDLPPIGEFTAEETRLYPLARTIARVVGRIVDKAIADGEEAKAIVEPYVNEIEHHETKKIMGVTWTHIAEDKGVTEEAQLPTPDERRKGDGEREGGDKGGDSRLRSVIPSSALPMIYFMAALIDFAA